MGVHGWRTVMLGIGGVVVSAGCTQPKPGPSGPAPVASARTPGRADTAVGGGRAVVTRVAVGRQAFQVASVATVTVAGDSAHHDTVTTASTVRVDARWTAGGFEVTGSVAVANAAPVAFSGAVDTATSRVRMTSDSLRCPQVNGAALAVGRDFLSSVPRTLVPGASWTDTVTTVACRGEIPVTTTAVRRFTVSRESDAILVGHTTDAALAGSTTKNGVRIELTGHGEGTASQRYEVPSGRLLGGSGTADVDLRVGTVGHPVELRQHVTTTTTPVA